MNARTFKINLIVATLATALAACGGGGDSTSAVGAGGTTGTGTGSSATTQDVTIEFAAFAGATPVNCGTAIAGLGSGNVTAQIKDFRFYISGVKLLKADDSEVSLTIGANDDWNHTAGGDSLTLIDLEDGTGSCTGGTAATNAVIKGTVPAGTYTGVKMTMGVPFALNHTDYAAAPRPLDIQAMAWSWQSGRKFAKVELTDPATPGTWSSPTFNFHLGSTGCTGNPATGQTVTCTTPNRMAFHFHSFNPATQKIALDVKALAAGTDITTNQAGAAGCMSGGTDPECLHVFEALAIDWKANGTGTGLPIDEGHPQTLFKAVAK